MRSIRANIESLLDEHKTELNAMNLAVAHSLGRYKVKFNPEKIDTMIVQAVSLLDDLDKELNNYVMRCREWYGWHFPELGKIIQDHQAFAKVIKAVGMRQNAVNVDLSAILPEELEAKLKEEAEISMGTDISELDLIHISGLCDQIIELSQYRAQLFDYLKNRMTALAPNLTCLLGELVGARLISHAGSLVSLAKAPASTVQILGAEKALFRALKTKKDTPKYGLIYHAQLITQAPAKLKGKMARKLAAKCALATRIDALADESKGPEVGMECRAGLEAVLRGELERGPKRISGASHKHEKYHFKSETFEYDATNDAPKKPVKRRFGDDDQEPSSKRVKVEEVEEAEEAVAVPKS
ncbi:snoRNA binding domain protein, partial [Cooperia oncophora]